MTTTGAFVPSFGGSHTEKKGSYFGGKLWVMLTFYRKCVCYGALSAVPSAYNPALQNTLAYNHEWANLAMLQE